MFSDHKSKSENNIEDVTKAYLSKPVCDVSVIDWVGPVVSAGKRRIGDFVHPIKTTLSHPVGETLHMAARRGL